MKSNLQLNSLNETYSIKNGIFTTMILNISNNYFSLFAIIVLGATNYQIGLINSLPQFIGMFAMFIGSIIVSRLETKKTFTIYSFLAARLFLLAMVFVVYLPESIRGWVFVILIGLMNLPGSFANLSWQAFISDLIPEKQRSRFFSERNRILTLVGMISTFIMGILLQMFDKSNSLPYQVLYLFAFLFGIAEIYYLKKHIEQKKIKQSEQKKLTLGLFVFKQKPYLYFVLCSLFFNFGWQMAWPLFNIYQIKYAEATGLWISLFVVANQISQVISFKWWGRMADKYGHAKMLILVAIGMATAPMLTVLSKNLVYLIFVNGFTGFFVSGTILILFNQLLEVSNEENRSAYIANYNVLLALIAFIAPQFGVYLLEMTNMNIAMNVSTILRLTSAIFFLMFALYLQKNSLHSYHSFGLKLALKKLRTFYQ
ncbi:MFS transporter [Bacillus sp. 03113]|uniref:MFS transporter n=1 Tax=Bacillus sp. 03113 TaxID=2578211 RepID=UPI0011450EC4|nr:MFS transporter [Bacillus sp. 03113]